MQTRFLVASLGLLLSMPGALWAQVSGPPPQPGQIDQGFVSPTLTSTPLSTGEKFNYHVIRTFGLRGAFGSAIAAGFGQLTDTPKEWGGGVQGYSERFASSFGGTLFRESTAWVIDSVHHEDPRYVPSAEKNFGARFANVLKQTLYTRTDSGGSSFAYGRVVSAFAAGQFVNIWQPRSNNSVGDGLERGGISIAGDAAYYFLQEFVPFTRPAEFRHRP